MVGTSYVPIGGRLSSSAPETRSTLLAKIVLTPDQQVALEFIRTRGLSIKYLDQEKRDSLRALFVEMHIVRGISLTDMAKLIGNKTSGYTSWLCHQLGVEARPFEEARLKGIREKRRKYERRPFDGTDEDKAYLIGLRHGDLSASKPWKGVVKVSTSTTHPAMASLFKSLFGPYGHVYQHPRYKKDTDSYEWNLSVNLDESFDFLLLPISSVFVWILPNASLVCCYLAGLFDAEGSVGIYPAKRLTSLNVIYYNTNLVLMRLVFKAITSLGLRPLPPYLDKKKGFRSPGYKIEMKKDYWRVLLARFKECQQLLRLLPIRHPERIAKKTLALSLPLGSSWNDVGPRVRMIKATVKKGRDEFVAEAKRVFLSKPHRSRSPVSE